MVLSGIAWSRTVRIHLPNSLRRSSTVGIEVDVLRIGTVHFYLTAYTIEMMDMPPASMRELARRLLAV